MPSDVAIRHPSAPNFRTTHFDNLPLLSNAVAEARGSAIPVNTSAYIHNHTTITVNDTG
jgi:hypothetical protein